MIQKLPAAEGKELSVLLSEILGDKSCKYCISYSEVFCDGKCVHHSKAMKQDGTCGDFILNPIPLDDWNVALKWRDWAVAEYGAREFMRAFYLTYKSLGTRHDFAEWAECYAQPQHYLQAAALCKLNAG